MPATISQCRKAASLALTLPATGAFVVDVQFSYSNSGSGTVVGPIVANGTSQTCTATAVLLEGTDTSPGATPAQSIAGSAAAFNYNLGPGDVVLRDAQARALDSLFATLMADLPAGTQLGN